MAKHVYPISRALSIWHFGACTGSTKPVEKNAEMYNQVDNLPTCSLRMHDRGLDSMLGRYVPESGNICVLVRTEWQKVGNGCAERSFENHPESTSAPSSSSSSSLVTLVACARASISETSDSSSRASRPTNVIVFRLFPHRG